MAMVWDEFMPSHISTEHNRTMSDILFWLRIGVEYVALSPSTGSLSRRALTLPSGA